MIRVQTVETKRERVIVYIFISNWEKKIDGFEQLEYDISVTTIINSDSNKQYEENKSTLVPKEQKTKKNVPDTRLVGITGYVD